MVMKQFFILLLIVLLSIANHSVMDNGRVVFNKNSAAIEHSEHSQSSENHFSSELEHHHDESKLSNTMEEFQITKLFQKFVNSELQSISEFSRSFWQPPKVS
jgi:hypothetical protein